MILLARRGLWFSAAILVAAVIVVMTTSAGCDGSGADQSVRTVAAGTQDVTRVASGELDDLSIGSAEVGDEITVTGTGWAVDGAVRFYLVTREQFQGALVPREAISVGEVSPGDDGGVALTFDLAGSYETPGGDTVHIEAGQQWYVQAYQSTGHGSHGAGVGPLAVK